MGSSKRASAPSDPEKKTKMTPAEQRAEFERAAREHGTDQNEEAFKGVLRKLGKAKHG